MDRQDEATNDPSERGNRQDRKRRGVSVDEGMLGDEEGHREAGAILVTTAPLPRAFLAATNAPTGRQGGRYQPTWSTRRSRRQCDIDDIGDVGQMEPFPEHPRR
jgi:hypothetical protein